MRLFYLLLIFAPGLLRAQFSGPNAVAYNAAVDKYFVSNYTAKNVIAMDRSGNKSVFISGLNAPNNVLFAKLPLGEGYLVLDSNEAVLYDSAGNYYVSQTISGARKLQDIVVDEDSAIIYISDVDRGVIYKTTFGPAPFFFPSTVIFVQNLRRPAALLLQKKKNRVVFGLDTAGTDLYAFDITTGTVSTIKTLGMNRIIGLGEDAQGNLYISSQGEKYIFQLNKYMSGTPKKLFGEPRPGDLYINPPKNEWVFTCVLCGTVNIAPIHDFAPMADMAGCRGDSVISYRSTLQKNYGSFDPGNEFIVEMSDSFGKFTTPTIIGRLKDTLLPAEVHCKLPINKKGSDKYRQRWRSTKPSVTGAFASMEVHKDPLAYLYGSPTVDACIGASILLGKNNKLSPDLTYAWYPPGQVDSPTNAKVQHLVADTQRILLQVVQTSTGCISKDSVLVMPVTKPDLGTWQDTLNVCSGSNISLGKTAKGGLTYAWTPGAGLSDSAIARPLILAKNSLNFTLKVSGAGGCFSIYKQHLNVRITPQFALLHDTGWLCSGDRLDNKILISGGSNIAFQWKLGPTILGTDTVHRFPYASSKTQYTARATDKGTGCLSQKFFWLFANPASTPTLLKVSDTVIQLNATGYHDLNWYRNDTLLPEVADQIITKQSGIYKVCALNASDCYGCSDTLRFIYNTPVSSVGGLSKNCRVFPNPAKDVVYLDCAGAYSTWSLMDLSGRALLRGQGPAVELKGLAPGNYFLLCEGNAIRVMLH